MIRIYVVQDEMKDGAHFSIHTAGHAETAVCAAASAIMQTAILGLVSLHQGHKGQVALSITRYSPKKRVAKKRER